MNLSIFYSCTESCDCVIPSYPFNTRHGHITRTFHIVGLFSFKIFSLYVPFDNVHSFHHVQVGNIFSILDSDRTPEVKVSQCLWSVLLRNFLFRFFLVKYADRGLVGSDVSNLWEMLYVITVFWFTIFSFLVTLLPSIRDYQGAIYNSENISCFSDVVVFRQFQFVNDSNIKEDLNYTVQVFPSAYLAVNFLIFLCSWIIFASVKYVEVKRPNLKRQYQRNIVTFTQNFIFYVCFFSISVSLTLVKIFVPRLSSSEDTKLILIFFYFVRLMFLCYLRPIIIIALLLRKMPHFFKNYEQEKSAILVFYISGKNVRARNEHFKPLKSFHNNARFGSEQKFKLLGGRMKINVIPAPEI